MPAKNQGGNTERSLQPLVAPRDNKSIGIGREVSLCRVCEQSDGGVIQCDGPCLGMYHAACTGHLSHDGSYLCEECYTGKSDSSIHTVSFHVSVMVNIFVFFLYFHMEMNKSCDLALASFVMTD